jgi:hypothetical protein
MSESERTTIKANVEKVKAEVAQSFGTSPDYVQYVAAANALLDLFEQFLVDVNRIADKGVAP